MRISERKTPDFTVFFFSPFFGLPSPNVIERENYEFLKSKNSGKGGFVKARK